jgi:hypothetical protein
VEPLPAVHDCVVLSRTGRATVAALGPTVKTTSTLLVPARGARRGAPPQSAQAPTRPMRDECSVRGLGSKDAHALSRSQT